MLDTRFAVHRTAGAALLASLATAQDWTQLTSTNAPPARAGTALAYDEISQRLILFGGTNTTGIRGTAFQDTWSFHGSTWQQLVTSQSPPARSRHTMFYVRLPHLPSYTWVFGGVDANGSPLNDIWWYDGSTWQTIYRPYSPSPRSDAANSGHLIFGGRNTATGQVFGDTWSWAPGTFTPFWTEMSVTGPEPRWGAAMSNPIDNSPVYLHGGVDAQGNVLSDTWTWYGRWTQVATGGPARAEHELTADPDTGLVYLSGGRSGQGLASEVWRFNGNEWLEMPPSAVSPTPVRAGASAFDTERNRMARFGGFDAGDSPTNVHWELTPPFFATTSFGSGCAAFGPTPELTTPSEAAAGTTLTFYANNVGRLDIAMLGIGFSDTQWNGAPLPTDLGAFRLPQCQLLTGPDQAYFFSRPGGFLYSVSVDIPADAALIGTPLFAQAFCLNVPTNRLRGVSNGLALEIF